MCAPFAMGALFRDDRHRWVEICIRSRHPYLLPAHERACRVHPKKKMAVRDRRANLRAKEKKKSVAENLKHCPLCYTERCGNKGALALLATLILTTCAPRADASTESKCMVFLEFRAIAVVYIYMRTFPKVVLKIQHKRERERRTRKAAKKHSMNLVERVHLFDGASPEKEEREREKKEPSRARVSLIGDNHTGSDRRKLSGVYYNLKKKEKKNRKKGCH